jgi:hypothetical protein
MQPLQLSLSACEYPKVRLSRHCDSRTWHFVRAKNPAFFFPSFFLAGGVAGFPKHVAEHWIDRLVGSGKCVSIVDQVAEPSSRTYAILNCHERRIDTLSQHCSLRRVTRKLSRVVTPGTWVYDHATLDQAKGAILASLVSSDQSDE